MNEDIKRAAYLLRVVQRFIKDNNLEFYTAVWDEVECDGHCLIDDCGSAAQQLEFLVEGE